MEDFGVLASYQNAAINMHEFMIPLMSGVSIVGGASMVFFLAKQRDVYFGKVPSFYRFIYVLQLIFAIFLLLNPSTWILAVQLTATSLFGLYSCFIFQRGWILVNTIFGLYNFLSVFGKIPFLGYSVVLYSQIDYTQARNNCISWFDISDSSSGLCNGYVSFLRVLAFLMIYTCAILFFFSYLLFKEFDSLSSAQIDEERKKFGSSSGSSTYESIGDGNNSE